MKNLSPELLQKYAELVLQAQAKGYPINTENIRKIAKETGNSAILREIEEELRVKVEKKDNTIFSKKTTQKPNLVDILTAKYVNVDNNQKINTEIRTKAKNEATKITAAIFIAVGCVVALVFGVVWYSGAMISMPRGRTIVFYDAITNAQSTKIWLIHQKYGKNTTINLIDGQNKKLLKEIESTINSPKVQVIDNKVYLFDDKSRFEARDSQTAEIILTDETFAKQFPQLKSDIGTAKYDNSWLDIVTKQGEVFYYHLTTNQLSTQKGKPDYFENVAFGQYKKMYNGEKVVFNANKTFLGSEVIFGDAAYCIVRHQTEIGKNGKAVFSCIDVKANKILWEMQNIDPKQSMLLAYFDKDYTYNLRCTRYENLLNISTPYCKIEGAKNFFNHVSCQIDIKTGKILWECAPTY